MLYKILISYTLKLVGRLYSSYLSRWTVKCMYICTQIDNKYELKNQNKKKN